MEVRIDKGNMKGKNVLFVINESITNRWSKDKKPIKIKELLRSIFLIFIFHINHWTDASMPHNNVLAIRCRWRCNALSLIGKILKSGLRSYLLCHFAAYEVYWLLVCVKIVNTHN